MDPLLRSFAPMRMTASWFGSLDPPNTRLWRDRFALERGLPSDRHLADPARLHSMVSPWPGRDEETGFETKKLTKEEKWAAQLKLLDKKSPIHGVHPLEWTGVMPF